MRDRPEARDFLAAMEQSPLGRAETPTTSIGVSGVSVRCPSCDHANPAGSNYCNQCGMPVHFEACGRCEAINLRGAPSCHKCGCILPGHASPESAATTAAAVVEMPAQVADQPDSTEDLPPPDSAERAPRPRRAAIRATLIAFGVALVAIPAYIATEHQASLHRVVDAIVRRASVGTDPPPRTSPQPSAALPVEQVDTPSVAPTPTREAVAPAAQAASAPPSEIARDTKRPDATALAAVPPPVARSARPPTTKSTRSKQGTSSRKPSTRKPAPKPS